MFNVYHCYVGLTILVLTKQLLTIFNFIDRTEADNHFGIALAYSLVVLFLAALLVKMDAVTEASSKDYWFFEIFLVVVFFAGPIIIMYQPLMEFLSVGLAVLWKKGMKPAKHMSADEVEHAYQRESQVRNNVAIIDGKSISMTGKCVCGNIFKGDSRYCRKCGAKRLTKLMEAKRHLKLSLQKLALSKKVGKSPKFEGGSRGVAEEAISTTPSMPGDAAVLVSSSREQKRKKRKQIGRASCRERV